MQRLHHRRRLGCPPTLHQRPQPPLGRHRGRYVCVCVLTYFQQLINYHSVLKKKKQQQPNSLIFTEKARHDAAASARLAPPSRSLVRPSSASRTHACSTPKTATPPGVLPPPGCRPGSAGPHLATVAMETSSLIHG